MQHAHVVVLSLASMFEALDLFGKYLFEENRMCQLWPGHHRWANSTLCSPKIAPYAVHAFHENDLKVGLWPIEIIDWSLEVK